MTQRFSHRFQWATTAIDAERDRSVFMPDDSLDQRVLHSGISQVVNERVTEAVEGPYCVGDAPHVLLY